MTEPMTREQARRLRQQQHRQRRREDYAARLGEWGVILAWTEEARAVAMARQKAGDQGAVVELAQLLETFCARYRQ